ncbi:ATP-binding cassette domain-containing protein [Nocardia brasiliensis]|uniref:ABC transporter ATP-binding protein n=1 Tax=Nocardia brasiliensis (strain ATCC 700358 / HUJEG-1) TaxID=1133849 RepID=K0F5P2_NOCB7|nr:ATP-binding cassette domain-containing protein [Nocardia brasiliensis]AFU05052.1 ABC transporter ATP-binding protein [Nocardia brasiliensis ATCC 700358]OCF85290.1 ABC transporter ATP-binding protein [Nocardia brasiliensis]
MSAVRPLAFAVRALTKRYGLVAAVENVSFTVPSGSTAALVGPRGAGKSTIVRILLGLLEPTSGTASIGGPGTHRSPAGASSAQIAGGVLAPRGIHPGRTARDHLWVYAAAVGVPDARVYEVLDLVGLGTEAGTKGAALSAGQQTRLALATALLADPPLLVLDEPMDGLDAAERGWLQDFLRRHAQRGGSAVVTSESLAAVLPGADEVIVLNAGAVVYEGSPARLRRGHPDRLVVAASTPIALATTLAARGFTDAVIRPDGRLAVAEATETEIRDAAAAAQVRLDSVVPDLIHPDRVLASLTRPPSPAPAHYPGLSGTAAPTPPMPYGIPR